MIKSVVLLALVGVCIASHDYGYYKHKPKTNRCFQCEYRPPKTRTYKVPRQESYDVQVPVHSQDCRDEKVIAGYKVTKVEKRTYHSYKPAHSSYGYQQHGYGYGNAYQPYQHNHGYQQPHGYQQHHGYQQPHGYHQEKPQSYSNSEPVYKTVKKCTPKVEYKTQTHSRTVYDTKSETGSYGGFEPCMGPITAESAKRDGVDDWECHSACYTRKDAYGNVSRGCYKGEYGVNPHSPGPQHINGQTYYFCEGSHCNGGDMH